MTIIVINKCSAITLAGFFLSFLAIVRLRMLINAKPHIMLAIIAVDSSNANTGTRNVKAKMNFETTVDIVDSHISFVVWSFSDSWDMCMPKPSDNASAIAIVRIPPITTIFELVTDFKPTIKPRVVIIPEVNPKLNPMFMDFFINEFGCYCIN